MKEMNVCSVCKEETNCKCKICQESICNRSLDCHVPVEEGSIPRWQMGQQIAICHPCKESPEEFSKGDVDGVNPENLRKLKMEQEYGNLHDPFAISIRTSLRGKISASCVMGHIRREISHFWHYFFN